MLFSVVVLCGLLLATVASGEQVSWSKGGDDCLLPAGLQISCGYYGTFYIFDGPEEAQICPGPDAVQGQSEAHLYPLPVPAPIIYDIPPNGVPLGGSGPAPNAGFSEIGDWIGLIDFGSVNHGLAVDWLTGAIAGPELDRELFFVDDPAALADLGDSVGDFHLLRSLCSIVERVDTDGQQPPSVVNMSLGRLAEADDRVDIETCSPDEIVCQIGLVVDYLRERGTAFVGAAGNHQRPLIPASLSNVASVGAARISALLNHRAAVPSWESASASAIFPANGLCLRGDFAAPAGSSYSSAVFSGWLAHSRLSLPTLDPLLGGQWAPHWSEHQRCYVLGVDGIDYTRCNPGFDALIEDLTVVEGNCWETDMDTIADGGPPDGFVELPKYPSFDEVASIHPTPQADPCVPCMGGPSQNLTGTGDPNDLAINMSQSEALPDDEYLQLVYLRVDDEFYPLNLSTTDLAAIQDGTIAYLSLPNWAQAIDLNLSASLFYVLTLVDPLQQVVDCQLEPMHCFWSATQVTWHSSLFP